jgi:integrase
MARKYIGITARKNGIQMSFTYKGKRIREHFRIEPNPQNMKAVSNRRVSALLDIELNKFDYYKHFPLGKNGRHFGKDNNAKKLFAVAANEWLQRQNKKLAYSTLKDYSSIIRCHLIPRFGGENLCEISTFEIEKWMTNLKLSPKRINNIMIVCRGVLGDAYKFNLIESNPTHKIDNLPLTTKEPQPLSLSEIHRILNELESVGKNLIQFAFFSGLRTSELIGLKWEHVDLKKDRIYVREAVVRNQTKQPKTSSGRRTVYLNEHSRDALISQKNLCGQRYDLVFFDDRNPGKALDDQKIRKRYWTPALKAAGIKYRRPYETRHTFASQMLDQGKKPAWLANQLGHANAAMTFSRYARWIPGNE